MATLRIFFFGIGGAILGMAFVASANIAGLVARYGLDQMTRDPADHTAKTLCYAAIILYGLATALIGTALTTPDRSKP